MIPKELYRRGKLVREDQSTDEFPVILDSDVELLVTNPDIQKRIKSITLVKLPQIYLDTPVGYIQLDSDSSITQMVKTYQPEDLVLYVTRDCLEFEME